MSGLVVKIGSDVKGALKGIEEVSISLKEQKAILANLQKQYAALSTQQARSAVGKEIAADIKIAKEEIARLSAVSTNSFGNVGKAATGALSTLRNFAYVLPGIGLAGIIGGLADMVIGLFKSAQAFDQADISAGHFSNTIKSLDQRISDLKNKLSFQSELNNLFLQLQGLTGGKLAAAQGTFNISQNAGAIADISAEINKLTEANKKMVEIRLEAEKLAGSIGAGMSPLAKAVLEFGSPDKIPENIASQLNKADKLLLSQYQTTANKIKSLSEQQRDLFQKNQLSLLQIALGIKNDKPSETRQDIKRVLRDALGSIQLELTPILDFKPDESAIKKSVRKLSEAINKEMSPAVSNKPSFINTAGIEQIRNGLLELAKVAEFVGNKFADIFDAAFDALLSGKNVIQSIGEALKQLVVDMVKAFARMAIIKGIASIFNLGGLFNFLPLRASGGPISANRNYIVGEHGPELFQSSQSGRIIPNNSMGSFMGSGLQAISVTVNGVISGRDLRLINAKEERYQNRNV